MKIKILCMLAILFSFLCQAQNTNLKTEVKTTTTTTKDSKGQKKTVKSQETKETQKIALEEEKATTLNIPVKASKVDVTTKTKVTVDGLTKSVDINHSAYYSMGGEKYQMNPDKSGYEMTNPNNQTKSLLRKTSNNNYIFKNKDTYAMGYFDSDGNLIVETYDEKTDAIILEKYMVVKP